MNRPGKTTIWGMIAGVSVPLLLASFSTTDRPDDSSSSSPSRDDASSTANEDADYENGTYTAKGEYGSLPSHITVDVTLDDDIITDVNVTPHATNETSLDLQRRFADAVPGEVVGKPIDEVDVGRLAGSSGTPNGFNDAIDQIEDQARSPQS